MCDLLVVAKIDMLDDDFDNDEISSFGFLAGGAIDVCFTVVLASDVVGAANVDAM